MALVEDESVSILGLSPTLVRALIPHGDPDADLTSLRTIVTTGEPWNPDVPLAVRAGRGLALPDHQLLRRHRGRRLLAHAPAMPIKARSLGGPAPVLAMTPDVEGESVVAQARSASSSAASRFPA